jgi:5,10-methylenetetrahydromethanopterin reductase
MQPSVRFGVSVLPGAASEVVTWSRVAEELGYARVGIGDSPRLYREPWMVLGAIAANTSHVPIAIWVTNPATRHPLITACAAATLDEMAPGRVSIGIGSGDSGITGAGRRPASIAQLRAYVVAVRDLLRRGEATYDGTIARLSWPLSVPRHRIPIYLAGHGEQAIRLAGEIADGVTLGLGISPDAVDRSLEWLSAGSLAGGRSVDELDVWWTVRFLVADDGQAAREEMAGILTEAAHMIARTAFRSGLGSAEQRASLERLAASFDHATYGSEDVAGRRERGRLAFEMGVADQLLDRFAFAGTAAQCRAQIERARREGANQFMYSMRGPDRDQRLRDWHRLVMQPLERDARATGT